MASLTPLGRVPPACFVGEVVGPAVEHLRSSKRQGRHHQPVVGYKRREGRREEWGSFRVLIFPLHAPLPSTTSPLTPNFRRSEMNETDVNYSPCGVASCKRPRRTRGVCQSCYLTARLMVKNGETTWDELVSLKVVSNGRRGRKHSSPLRAYYTKRKAKAALNKSPLQLEESQVTQRRQWAEGRM